MDHALSFQYRSLPWSPWRLAQCSLSDVVVGNGSRPFISVQESPLIALTFSPVFFVRRRCWQWNRPFHFSAWVSFEKRQHRHPWLLTLQPPYHPPHPHPRFMPPPVPLPPPPAFVLSLTSIFGCIDLRRSSLRCNAVLPFAISLLICCLLCNAFGPPGRIYYWSQFTRFASTNEWSTVSWRTLSKSERELHLTVSSTERMLCTVSKSERELHLTVSSTERLLSTLSESERELHFTCLTRRGCLVYEYTF